MCNLYSLRRSRAEVARTFAATDRAGDGTWPDTVHPDRMAPVVRADAAGGRELVLARWGFPPPPMGGRPVTNIRNTGSAFWRPWLKDEHRCLVPLTAFCEYTDTLPKVPHWFAAGADRPLLAFAGVWRPWTGTRGTKAAPVAGDHELFAFLTTAPNAVVGPVHAKAMPVLLTTAEEWDLWLHAPAPVALDLQRPAGAAAVGVVAKGVREDPWPAP